MWDDRDMLQRGYDLLRVSFPCRGSQGDRSKASSAPRPGRDGYTTALLQEAGCMLLRKCCDIYPCTRLALQVAMRASTCPAPLTLDCTAW